MTFDVEIPNEMTICGGSIPSSCADAIVVNSDGTYYERVPSGGTFVLPDTTYNFNINGVTTSETVPSLADNTFNILWQ